MTAARRARTIFLSAAALAGAALGGFMLPAREGGAPMIPAGEFRQTSTPSLSHDGRRFVFSGRRESDGVAGIWEMEIDGSSARLITTGNGEASEPAWMPDGKIVYRDLVAADRLDDGDPRALFACRDDGTGTSRLTFGAHADGRPEPLPDGRILFERRFNTPILGREFIHMTIHPDGTQIAFHDDAVRPEAARTPMETPRSRPPILTSVVDAGRSTGTLLCLDAYASRLPGVSALPRGAIRSVLVTRADENAGAASLGEAPVHPDGSFFIEVPADIALRLTLLDADRRPLASLHSGIWVRGNENRGCIGCHEEPDLAPENRRPLAIAEPPVPMTVPPLSAGVAHAH